MFRRGILLLSLIPLTSAASEGPKAKTHRFGMRYASSPWNTSSKTIDSAFMFLRDKNSGRIAKILLEETEPDSSIFSGRFSLNWGDSADIKPEVYVPPENLRNDSRAIERFNSLLKNDQVQPQPLYVREDKNEQIFEVFDTDEQAKRAQEAYQLELEAIKKTEQAKLIKPATDDSSLQVAKLAEQAAAVAKLAKEEAERESERIRLEQLERQKMEQKRKEEAQLAEAERQKRKRQAEELAQRASEQYQLSQYAKAEELFRKAVELDPTNHSYYFKYGVSLYRVDKFDEALVTLKLADTDYTTDLERKYYIGLIHFRLKELEAADRTFEEVKAAKDPTLSPSAAFYQGLVLFSKEELVKAQAAFEFVLDNSNDPALDRKAEEYIEKIARMNEYKKMAGKKFLLNAEAGLIYDSNILQSPDNDTTSSVSNKGGGRWMVGGDAEYRFYFKETSDLSAKVAASNTQSFSIDFVKADPLTYSVTLPLNYKGTFKSNKGYKLGLTPGYESLYLQYNSSSNRIDVLNSIMLNTDFMVVMRDDWFSSYNLDIRQDDSLIPGVVAGSDDDADALKLSFKKTETLFLDGSKKRAIIGSLGYVLNNAEGKEKKYNRIELSATYLAPVLKFANTTWTGGLSAFQQNYSSGQDGRKDTDIAIAFGWNKVLNEQWSWTANATYTSNTSNVDTYDYSKYLVMGTIHYNWSH